MSNDRCCIDTKLGSPGLEGDFYTPEQQIGGFDASRPWESCMTVSAHNHWSWGGANDGVKSAATCIRMLVNCAGGDGNMLLNVGPRPDGVIDPAQAGVLKGIGAWLSKYGESIYGTRGGPFKPGAWGASTHKDKTVYLHILHWPSDTIHLPGIQSRVLKYSVLTGGEATVKQTDTGITVTVPAASRDAVDTIVKIELDAPIAASE
jgi:alpha-L-fucosidase